MSHNFNKLGGGIGEDFVLIPKDLTIASDNSKEIVGATIKFDNPKVLTENFRQMEDASRILFVKLNEMLSEYNSKKNS